MRRREAMGHLSDEELAAGAFVMARLHALVEGYCKERTGVE